MTRFPTYPPDILSRADALLSEKYPDGIVDPRFVEIACEAMMMERSLMARELLAEQAQELNMGYEPSPLPIGETQRRMTAEADRTQGRPTDETFARFHAAVDEAVAKAIRGTK
jgi:hypothetical protein